MSDTMELVDSVVDSNSQTVNNSENQNQESVSDTNVSETTNNEQKQNDNVNIQENEDVKKEVQEKEELKITPEMYYNRLEEARRLQSERDKAEAYTKKLLSEVIKYVDIDEYGNIIGPKQQQQDNTKALYERAAMGDVDAVRQLNELVKEQAKREALNEFLEIKNQEALKNQIVNEIKQEFPDLIDNSGNINMNNPIWEEANKIVNVERQGLYDLNNPYHLKTVLEVARGRVLMRAYPELKKEIKKEVVNNVRKTGAMSTASPAGDTKEENDIVLTQEQINALKRTGKDTPDDLRRIINIVKQVKDGSFELQ